MHVRGTEEGVGTLLRVLSAQMSDFRGLKGFALARESAFFKVEQEADIQRHRSRLVTQGRIEDIAGGYLMPRRQQTLAESAQAFEVLAEVLQQQVRLDDPTAAQRKNFLRKVRGQLPQLTAAESQKYRSSMYGMAAIGQIPRVNLGRNRFTAMHSPKGGLPALKLSPQAQEAARRSFSSGARSLLYGSFLGVAGVAILVAAGARIFDVTSPQDLRDRAAADGPLAAEAFRGWLLPVKASIQGFVGHREEKQASPFADWELREKLSRRITPRQRQSRDPEANSSEQAA